MLRRHARREVHRRRLHGPKSHDANHGHRGRCGRPGRHATPPPAARRGQTPPAGRTGGRRGGGRAAGAAAAVVSVATTPGISIPATGRADSSGCRPPSVAPTLGATPRCYRHATSVTASTTATAILRSRRLRRGARGNVCPGHPCPCGRGAHGRRRNVMGRRRRRRFINLRLRLHRSPDRRRGGGRRAGHWPGGGRWQALTPSGQGRLPPPPQSIQHVRSVMVAAAVPAARRRAATDPTQR